MKRPITTSAISIAALQLVLFGPVAAQAVTDIPDIARALLDAAYATEDETEINAVAKAVSAVFPDYEAQINESAAFKISELTPPPEESTGSAEAEAEEEFVPVGGFFSIGAWEGKAQVGASFASGNSDNLAVGFGLDASRTVGKFVHNVSAFYDIAESDDVRTQNRFGGAYQLDYTFSDDLYAYGRVSYEDDEFSGFDYRFFAGGGIGYFLAQSERLTSKLEGGPGYRISPLDDTRETLRDFALYGASETDWVIREGILLEQDFFVTWTSPTTTFQSVTALTTALTDSISTSIAFDWRYETNPPLGNVNSDTTARASLVYGF